MKKPVLIATYKKYLLIAFIFMLIIPSCNIHIEKRRYRKGYYIEVSKNHLGVERTTSNQMIFEKNEAVPFKTTSTERIDSLKKIPVIKNNQSFVVNNNIPVKEKSISNLPLHKKRDGDCDVIYLLDGSKIEASVISFSNTEISYKKCNFIDGPTYKISTSKIKNIDFKDGKVYTPDYTQVNSKSINGTMIAGIILAAIAFICLIIGIVMVVTTVGLSSLIAAIPLAIAGITSLVGFIINIQFLQKGVHVLGKVAFTANLIFQVLAIIFTVLMFFI